MVDARGIPVLIDFGSCREMGEKLSPSRGTAGWIEGVVGDYDTSDGGHDLYALEKIRTWLDNPSLA
jgi:hypothetical protein